MSPRAQIFGKRAAILNNITPFLKKSHFMRVNGKINVKFLREQMPPEVTLDSFFLQYYDLDL